ncbi:hypothetical protein AAVH_06654 [Aphelenchoides avenae]|nr:hypothetical protein AAVH_06654 [Aphelenchus avenae]
MPRRTIPRDDRVHSRWQMSCEARFPLNGKKTGKRGPGRPPKARPVPSVPIKPLSAEKKPAATSTPLKPPQPGVQSSPSMPSAGQLKQSIKTRADGCEKVTFKGTFMKFEEGTVDELETLVLEDGEQNGFEKGLKCGAPLEYNGKMSCVVRFVGHPMPQLIPAEEVDKHAPLELMWYSRLKTRGIIV